jgi:hypothetical protein
MTEEEVKKTSILFDCFVNWAETMFTFDEFKRKSDPEKAGNNKK